jgi:hypothetical protein
MDIHRSQESSDYDGGDVEAGSIPGGIAVDAELDTPLVALSVELDDGVIHSRRPC